MTVCVAVKVHDCFEFAADSTTSAVFLVDVTKRYFAFLPGADIVGGDTGIAIVTKYEGFK